MPPKKDHTDKGLVAWDPFNSTPTPTTTPNRPRATQQKDDFPALGEGSKSKNTNNNVLQPNANPKVNSKLDPTASVWTPNKKLSANPDYDGLPSPTKHAWDTKPPVPHIFKDGTPINPPENKSATTSRPEGAGSAHGALPIHTKPENINPTGPSAKTISASQPSSEFQRVNHILAAYVHRVSHDTLAYPFVGMDSPLWEAPCFVYTSLERSKLSTYLNPATIKRMKTAGHWIGKDGSYVNGKVKYDRYVSGLEEGMQQEQEQADEINRMRSIGYRKREVSLKGTASARIGDGFASGIHTIRCRAVLGAMAEEMAVGMLEEVVVAEEVLDVEVLAIVVEEMVVAVEVLDVDVVAIVAIVAIVVGVVDVAVVVVAAEGIEVAHLALESDRNGRLGHTFL